MPALLALIPVKDWIYAGIIAALLGTFAWYTHHERVIGEQKIETADKKVADAAAQHVHDVQTIAAATQTKIGETYAQTLATPPAPAPVVRLCHVASASRAMSSAPGANTSASSAANSGSTDTSNFAAGPDIGLKLITIGHDADALITALQAENAELRAEMTAK
jgi:hypothetical protein